MMESITGSYTLKQILQDHWAVFTAKHDPQLRPSIVEEVEKILHCRDFFHLGYHEYQCPQGCACKRIVPHSCKSRFCSSCGKVATDNWMAKALGDFLDVPYHHLVFTIPCELRNVFAWDRQQLGVLFTSAKDTVLEWCRDKGGYVPGIVMVMHTFGSDLKFNPHVHMLITEGGLSPDRTKWLHNEFIPWAMLKARWKHHVVKALRPRLKELIRQKQIGTEYLRLGKGSLFRQILGLPVSEDLVCLDGCQA
jgi:hypothetical protein